MLIVGGNNLPISIIHTSYLSIISCNGSSEKIGFYSEELSFIMSNFAFEVHAKFDIIKLNSSE